MVLLLFGETCDPLFLSESDWNQTLYAKLGARLCHVELQDENIMRILHLITGLGDGGAEGNLYRLAISDSRHEHFVISMSSPGKYGPMLEEEGVKVHALGISSKFLWLGKLVHASRLTREIRPDVIQTWMPHADFFGTLLAALSRVRKIYWGVRNGTYNEVHSPLGTRLIVRLLAFLSWFAPDAIVSCSEAAVASHVALGYNPGKFVVIPNGVDTRAFGPRKKNDALAPTSVFLIGMFARFHPQKDHYSFLKSISVLSQNGFRCDAILVGNGVDSNNVLLNRWIDELGIRKRVTLLGARTDVSELMNSVDLVVMCSTFGEGFPNVVAEAMATGTPCVVTDVGDALSIVGELGWQAEPANPVDLASTIAEAYADIQLEPPNIRAIRAARISKNYSLRTMVERFDSLYDLVSIAFLTRYSIQGAS